MRIPPGVLRETRVCGGGFWRVVASRHALAGATGQHTDHRNGALSAEQQFGNLLRCLFVEGDHVGVGVERELDARMGAPSSRKVPPSLAIRIPGRPWRRGRR